MQHSRIPPSPPARSAPGPTPCSPGMVQWKGHGWAVSLLVLPCLARPLSFACQAAQGGPPPPKTFKVASKQRTVGEERRQPPELPPLGSASLSLSLAADRGEKRAAHQQRRRAEEESHGCPQSQGCLVPEHVPPLPLHTTVCWSIFAFLNIPKERLHHWREYL